MINHLTYTRINILYFLLFALSKNKYLGIYCIDSSLAVLLSFESLHIYDPHVISVLKKENENLYLCKFDRNFFYFYDFILHLGPLIYLVCKIPYSSISKIKLLEFYLISLTSCIMHLSWGYVVSNGTYKLEHIYIPESHYVLKDNVWNNLWEISIFGHFLLPNIIVCNRIFDIIVQ